MTPYPSRSALLEIFSYDPDTGILTRRIPRGNRTTGAEVGHPCSKGYLQVRVGRKTLSVARIAYIIAYDANPEQIDHINRNRTDNRLCNLRASSQTLNARNKSVQKNNSTGTAGVSFDAQSGRFKVRIGIGKGKRKTIGLFRVLEDAIRAREQAVRDHW